MRCKRIGPATCLLIVVQKSGSGMMLATDGWKNKYAEDGAGLINVCALLPGGGSTFLKVRPVA
jgi:hypothetical protein